MKSKLIVALDCASEAEALTLVAKLNPEVCGLKVGSELFTLLGPRFVSFLVDKRFKVFLDLKFHDIPNTVAKACKQAADLGVWMLNVHALGGLDMMKEAKASLTSYGDEAPLLIAVTVLTSMNSNHLKTLGFIYPLEAEVNLLAKLAAEAGLDGVVCSAWEVPAIKAECGASFLTITPGIRLKNDKAHDQVRIVTPEEAVAFGSDYLVMGRSISHATCATTALEEVFVSMNHAEAKF